jgi:cohesin domain-containing protein
VMLLTPHIVRTHELSAEDLAPIFIGTQSNVGIGGPPPLIAPQPEAAAPTEPAVSGVPGAPAPGMPRPPVAAETGVPPANRPLPPGTTPVPSPVSPLPGTTTTAGAPPAGVLPPGAPPRDPSQPPATNPGAPGAAPATPAQIIVTPAGTEFRIGGPFPAPISINNAQRVSTLTLTVVYNPNVIRVRAVQQGTFMGQGGITASFTPKIDAAGGRVDIVITRIGDQVGASGGGLIGSLAFDAVGAGASLISVSGAATAPDGAALPLQFSPVTVTVR